ncbi:MAG: hypothetical protein M1815_006203 [Lichina confinis]|nr:MAG: hypothetical protein M1815_006203 [Lichina confinis]
MSSYLSSILTTTTSRYNSIRRTILSDETDGDTEDDTHISRVLRAYYVEKGRPFPPWLPPDPRAPQRPALTHFTSTASRPGQGPPSHAAGRGGGLSDLWDAPGQGAAQQEPLSLRRGGPGVGHARPSPATAGGPFAERQGSDGALLGVYAAGGVRSAAQQPYPTQRADSYQSSLPGARQPSGDSSSSPPRPLFPPSTASSSSGISAQQRLKARLLGGSTRSPSPTQLSSISSPPPAPQATPMPGQQQADYYDGRGHSRYGTSSSQGTQSSGQSLGGRDTGYAAAGQGSYNTRRYPSSQARAPGSPAVGYPTTGYGMPGEGRVPRREETGASDAYARHRWGSSGDDGVGSGSSGGAGNRYGGLAKRPGLGFP